MFSLSRQSNNFNQLIWRSITLDMLKTSLLCFLFNSLLLRQVRGQIKLTLPTVKGNGRHNTLQDLRHNFKSPRGDYITSEEYGSYESYLESIFESSEENNVSPPCPRDWNVCLKIGDSSGNLGRRYGNVYAINSENKWGPVCDDANWNDVAARVVCR